MKENKHFFEGHVYLISNRAVARNPLFPNLELQEYFKSKMEYYLSPLSEIITYSMHGDEFQILVKLKSRQAFTEFYAKKKKPEGPLGYPESTYIFSQAMSNLQVSYVKHFNWKYKRSGTLMASRFKRQLITSSEELSTIVEQINSGKKYFQRTKNWKNDFMVNKNIETGKWLEQMYELEGDVGYPDNYLNIKKIDLVSQFKSLPLLRLHSTSNYYLRHYYRLFTPNSGSVN